jgi:uncharacterized protein
LKIKRFLVENWGIILSGGLIGLIAVTLQKFGNPANMGFCMACFTRDISGAIGFHQAMVVKYIRPEIVGIVLGALFSSLAFKEFKSRGGSSPIVRFVLGMIAMIGALIFLGCPWRAMLRLSGGDWNSILGIAGLVAGIYIGSLFIKRGYDLGESHPFRGTAGYLFPIIMVFILSLAFIFPQIMGQVKSGIISYSVKGPGAQHAPLFLSLLGGLIVGVIAQRSRFCTIGGFRNIFLFKQFHLLSGVLSLLLSVFVLNLILGQFSPGFTGQPAAHTLPLWNFLGMVLSGLAFTLAGGCPGRQLIMAGEGNSDAAVFSLGMLVGAGVAHNFLLTASPKGIGTYTVAGTVVCFIVLIWIGFNMKELND